MTIFPTIQRSQSILTALVYPEEADMEAAIPDWLAEGAVAAWNFQEQSGFFLDDGVNFWDITYTAVNPRAHDFLPSVHLKQGANSFGTGTYADARIVGEMSIALLCKWEGIAAHGGLFCYTTSPTVDALWGIGVDASGRPAFFDKRHGGAIIPYPTLYLTSAGDTKVLIATRSATGIVKVYVDGYLVRTTSAVAAPTVLGTEVIAFGGRNYFSHGGLWETELSLQDVQRLTKATKPWLNL